MVLGSHSRSSPRLMTVNVVAEAQFIFRGHGVESAVQDLLVQLRSLGTLDVRFNSFRRADVVHVHTVGPWSLAHLVASRGHRIVTAHVDSGSLSGSIVGAALLTPCINRYLRWFLSKAHTVVALNSFQAVMLTDLLPDRRVVILGNAPPSAPARGEISRKQARQKLQLDERKKIVVTVGQLQPRKGLDDFLVAAQQVPEAEFVWVGGLPFGPLSAQHSRMRRLSSRAYTNVTFVGQLSRSRVMEYLRAADVFFHPSLYENDPVAVLEAVRAGLPLVLRDLPCYTSPIRDWSLLGDSDSFQEMLRRQLSDPLAPVRAQHLARMVARKASEQQAELLEIYGLDAH